MEEQKKTATIVTNELSVHRTFYQQKIDEMRDFARKFRPTVRQAEEPPTQGEDECDYKDLAAKLA